MKFLSILFLGFIVQLNAFALKSGTKAPEFTARTSEGKTIKLSDYAGKVVVLEWKNHGCPFIKKHYDSGNMQALQKEYTAKKVVWLSVISSAPGKEGYSDAAQAEKDKKDFGAAPTAIILDEKGEMGKMYSAQTTPHMYVIDAKGVLVYQGAIDDKPSTDVADVKTAKSYLREALDATLTGKKVAVAQTKAYGCGVKYLVP